MIQTVLDLIHQNEQAQREQLTETHLKDRVAVAAFQAYNQNIGHQKEERQLLIHHD